MSHQLRETLNLPQTDFPMRANLTQREPERLEHWRSIDLYGRIQEKNRGGPAFTLHDGPPFTNGDLHLGHALNKTLKDTILRFKWMQGFDAPFVPGWDSHGLPIEHKVSRDLREAGRTDYSVAELRHACAEFADRYRQIQGKQFERLGILGEWDNAYWTVYPDYEATELETFARFVELGLVYRSKKPVYWSIPCATALAEAEIEYRPHRSPSIYVAFPLEEGEAVRLGVQEPAAVLIWTTTPWTLPANLAIAVHPRVRYQWVKVDGRRFLVAEDLIEEVASACGWRELETGAAVSGEDLAGLRARHPFIDRASPVVLADYVTTESGTGCVHTAPGHGLEDYQTGIREGLEIYCPLDDGGRYLDDGQIPAVLVGETVLETKGKSPANVKVLELLEASGSIVHLDFIEHSYPHCWRSKTPVIFRAMDQWFIALDHNGARQKALDALEEVRFIPAAGRSRLREAVANRPDWCISRQRSWGVPIPAFYDGEGRAYLDAGVVQAVGAKIARHGSDFWFANSAEEILRDVPLPEGWPDPESLTAGSDTLDVWIDSGCSHRAVLQKRDSLRWPADLYLEGSDQHRGWFQSSLWTGVLGDGQAPYRTILTHGFIVREDRTKLSKSSGDTRSLEEWISGYGGDIIRLWICSQDYRGDVPVSDKIVKNVSNAYRNLRNTLRFQIGNLHDFDRDRDAVPVSDLDPLDRWILHELAELVDAVTEAYDQYEFHRAFKDHLDRFCSQTLSATYHDILKDRLYTRAPNDPLRRSSQTAIDIVFRTFTRLLAPLIPFTADEAWAYARSGKDFTDQPIALEPWPNVDPQWRCPEVAGDIRELRRFLGTHLNDKLELLRQQKVIGQSLDAKAVVRGRPGDPLFDLLNRYRGSLPELFILSQVELETDPSLKQTSSVTVEHADGVRCPRSWRWVSHLENVESFGEVSPRCAAALREIATTTD